MAQKNENYYRTIPVGRLGIIPHKSCTELGRKVDAYLVKWRCERENSSKNHLAYDGYRRNTYIILPRLPASVPGRQKALSMNLSGETICIFWWTCAITPSPTLSAATKTTCLPMTTFRI